MIIKDIDIMFYTVLRVYVFWILRPSARLVSNCWYEGKKKKDMKRKIWEGKIEKENRNRLRIMGKKGK